MATIPLTCKVIRSKRRTLAVQVDQDGAVIVRVPKYVLNLQIKRFVQRMRGWIEKQQEKMQKRPKITPRKLEHPIGWYKKEARRVFTERLNYFAQLHDLTYKTLRLSSARTRWGSCSRRKSINLNWRLILAPPEILDYVVAHELSHTVHMNHSKRFWAQVEAMMPNHKIQKKWLKEFGPTLHTEARFQK